MKRKEDRSLFIRPHEGLFGLREWIDEEIEFHVSLVPPAICPKQRKSVIMYWTLDS